MQGSDRLSASGDPFLHMSVDKKSLTFIRVLPHHTNNYTCTAVSSAGNDNLTYSLIVTGIFSGWIDNLTIIKNQLKKQNHFRWTDKQMNYWLLQSILIC